MDDYKKRIEATVHFFRERIHVAPDVVLALGTGLGGLVEEIDVSFALPYKEIPNFPDATVESHAGNLVFGVLGGKSVAVLQGRFHYYEGYSTRELTTPLRVLSLLGAKKFIVTNSAGGLNKDFKPGTIMVLSDHINLIPDNPLRGVNIDEWGPRFPDLSQVYDRQMIALAMSCGKRLGMKELTTGVYVAISGPSLETPAETRYIRAIGADAVGMSTVPEVIVARHAGLRTMGISVIANVNDPDNFQPILLEDVIRQSEKSAGVLGKLLVEIVTGL